MSETIHFRDLHVGDRILDTAGYPVIQHLGEAASILFAPASELSKRFMNPDDELSVEEYVDAIHVRNQIHTAYSKRGKLPEGARIEPPTPEEMALIRSMIRNHP